MSAPPFPSYDGSSFSPLMLELLIQLGSSVQIQNLEFPAQQAALKFFVEKGLVAADEESWWLTDRGETVREKLLRHAAELVEVL